VQYFLGISTVTEEILYIKQRITVHRVYDFIVLHSLLILLSMVPTYAAKFIGTLTVNGLCIG